MLFEDEAGLLAGAGVAAGLPAGAADSLLAAAGAGVDLLAGAELSAASAEVLFFDRDFFVVVAASDPLVFAVESAVGALPVVELSAAFFFERLFLVVAAELSDAAASVLAAAFFLDLEVLLLVESADASGLVCEASEAAAFFFAFFLVELVSVWSVEPDELDCCAARTVTLPKISSMATAKANGTPLLDLIWLSPPPVTAVRP